MVEAGEPCDEEPADHREHRDPDRDQDPAVGKPAMAEIAKTNCEVGRPIRLVAGESVKWRRFRHLQSRTGLPSGWLRQPRYAQVSCRPAELWVNLMAAPRFPTPGGYVDGDAPDSTDPIALARQVVEDAIHMARAEFAVVATELRRAVLQLAIAIALIMVAAVFLLIAVIEALNALPSGLGILGSEWVRWLVLGGIFLILAGVLIYIGQSRARKAIKRGRKQVQGTLKEDAEWLRELTKRSVKGS